MHVLPSHEYGVWQRIFPHVARQSPFDGPRPVSTQTLGETHRERQEANGIQTPFTQAPDGAHAESLEHAQAAPPPRTRTKSAALNTRAKNFMPPMLSTCVCVCVEFCGFHGVVRVGACRARPWAHAMRPYIIVVIYFPVLHDRLHLITKAPGRAREKDGWE